MLSLALSIALASPAQPGVGWVVDWTTLKARQDAGWASWPLLHTDPCEAAPTAVLGVAAVIYSRKGGTMAWGHASLRVVACEKGELVDREYETYRMSGWNEAMFREEHAGEPYLDTIHAHRGELVLFRNRDPADGGWYGDAQAKNREVYEVWLDLSPERRQEVAEQAEAWYAAQRATLRKGGALPERYRPLSTNCTAVLSALVPDILAGDKPPPVLPFAWFRRLDDGAVTLRVVRPSHALARRIPGVEYLEKRPRPVFRWTRQLSEPAERWVTVAQTPPSGPWTVP